LQYSTVSTIASMSAMVQLGINALAVEIQRQRHDIDIARAFAIAEQRALDPPRRRPGRRARRATPVAAIVVRMHRQHDRSRPAMWRPNHSIWSA